MATCRDCGESIVWMKSRTGKNIAAEPDSVDDPEAVFDRNAGNRCHWDVCVSRIKEENDEEDPSINPNIKPDDSGKVPF